MTISVCSRARKRDIIHLAPQCVLFHAFVAFCYHDSLKLCDFHQHLVWLLTSCPVLESHIWRAEHHSPSIQYLNSLTAGSSYQHQIRLLQLTNIAAFVQPPTSAKSLSPCISAFQAPSQLQIHNSQRARWVYTIHFPHQ